MTKKSPLRRNIKVDVYDSTVTPPVRTSTTLNYQLCNYLFFHSKSQNSSKSRSAESHRKWLVNEVQQWVNANSKGMSSSSQLEHLLAYELFNEGFEQAKKIYTSANLHLDL